MMKKTKVIEKGYTLTVTSWENDGDNYSTNSLVFESRDTSIAVARMCRDLFCSTNGRPKGIGNTIDRGDATPLILKYMKEHPEVCDDVETDRDLTDNDLISICIEYNRNLLGHSDCYFSRVFDSATLTFSPEDVYLENVEF